MQYLIKKTTHNTGEVFTDIVKAKDNETFTVVEADSKEGALEKVKKPKGLLEVIPSSFNNNPISRALKIDRKDSE